MTGSELKQRRDSLGLTQSQLAELLGVRQSAVSTWESGAAPIPHYRARLIEIDLKRVRPRKRVETRGRPRKTGKVAERADNNRRQS